jgi:hypothetical protein
MPAHERMARFFIIGLSGAARPIVSTAFFMGISA